MQKKNNEHPYFTSIICLLFNMYTRYSGKKKQKKNNTENKNNN